jgi:hypothetical protein
MELERKKRRKEDQKILAKKPKEREAKNTHLQKKKGTKKVDLKKKTLS